MIIHRRTWFYRLLGQDFAEQISFKTPVTAQQVKIALHRMFGPAPIEIFH